MKVSLYKGLDKTGKQDVKASFIQGLQFRNALRKNIHTKIDEWRKKSRSPTFILEGDYAVKMAWGMGYEHAYEELLLLLQEGDKK